MPEVQKRPERLAPKLKTQSVEALQGQVAELQIAVERIEKQQAVLSSRLELLFKIHAETRSLLVELSKRG